MTTKNTAIKALKKKLEEAETKYLVSMKISIEAIENKESEVYIDVCKESVLEIKGYVNGLLEAIETVQRIKED